MGSKHLSTVQKAVKVLSAYMQGFCQLKYLQQLGPWEVEASGQGAFALKQLLKSTSDLKHRAPMFSHILRFTHHWWTWLLEELTGI
jgi:hypothetical protein